MDNILTENIPKKRGRKKKQLDETPVNKEDKIKKKRGRKKKWEVETTTKILNHNQIIFEDNIKSEETIIEKNNYDQEQVLFGNLNIKLHTTKEQSNYDSIKDTLVKNKKDQIKLSTSDSEDSENESLDTFNIKSKNKKMLNQNLDIKNIKCMKFFSDEFDNGKEILFSNYRCYNCHYKFLNQPFFLPISYCSIQNKYKVYGNFCSPNCVKSYALNSKTLNNKVYLVGEMYKKILGYNYIIKPAPPINLLKDYGGPLTIQEYRNNFNNKITYKLKPLCSKILFEEVIIK